MLLTDIGMPRMDGVQLAHTMIEAFPGVRVIYTACGEPDCPVVEDLGRKEFRFLTKPLEPEVVLQAIHSVLKPRSRRR